MSGHHPESEYSAEAYAWRAEAASGRAPHFGHSYYGHGVDVMSVATGNDVSPSCCVEGRGTIRWKCVNKSRIPRVVNFSAAANERRIRWTEGVGPSDHERHISKLVRGTPPSQSFRAEYNLCCWFEVVSSGPENVQTRSPAARAEFLLVSDFEVKRVDDGGNGMRRDWLKAVCEAGKGLPGGRILLGPLISLRNDEKRNAEKVELNARLQEIADGTRGTGDEILAAVWRQEEITRETQVSIDVALNILNQLIETLQGKPDAPLNVSQAVTLKTSVSPIPFATQILVDELIALFEDDVTPVEDCVKAVIGLKMPPRKASNVAYIRGVVDGLTGQSRADVERLFSCLAQKRKGSEILKALAEYFRNAGD